MVTVVLNYLFHSFLIYTLVCSVIQLFLELAISPYYKNLWDQITYRCDKTTAILLLFWVKWNFFYLEHRSIVNWCDFNCRTWCWIGSSIYILHPQCGRYRGCYTQRECGFQMAWLNNQFNCHTWCWIGSSIYISHPHCGRFRGCYTQRECGFQMAWLNNQFNCHTWCWIGSSIYISHPNVEDLEGVTHTGSVNFKWLGSITSSTVTPDAELALQFTFHTPLWKI